MKVFNSDITFPVDIDSTLIMWVKPDDIRYARGIKLNYYGEEVRAIPHEENIRLLKSSVARGRNVIVWSGNGYAWVVEVLTQLGLDSLNVSVMSNQLVI